MYQKIITIYAAVAGTILVIALAILAINSFKKDTIVVDASAYIAKELKASENRVLELDNKYQEMFLDMVQQYRQIDSLKATIEKRNKRIDYLKIKITKNETIVNDINLSDVQHDSLFARFLNGKD